MNRESLLNFISTNLNLSAVQIAGHFNYSYRHFYSLFKQIFDISPQNFILICRINKAKKLAENKFASAKEVAFKCGFGSISQFYREFNKQVGTTFIQYRNFYGAEINRDEFFAEIGKAKKFFKKKA